MQQVDKDASLYVAVRREIICIQICNGFLVKDFWLLYHDLLDCIVDETRKKLPPGTDFSRQMAPPYSDSKIQYRHLFCFFIVLSRYRRWIIVFSNGD